MQLTQLEKEIVAIGASVGAGCRPCLKHHLNVARAVGVLDNEATKLVYLAKEIKMLSLNLLVDFAHELLAGEDEEPSNEKLNRINDKRDALVAIGTVVGTNSSTLLDDVLKTAAGIGLTSEQITVAIRIAQAVQQEGANSIKKKIEMYSQPGTPQAESDDSCCDQVTEAVDQTVIGCGCAGSEPGKGSCC